jgi:hypothetical protein
VVPYGRDRRRRQPRSDWRSPPSCANCAASRELRRANILKAPGFFVAEVDRATAELMSFIDAHADRCTDDGLRWGVEPIRDVLAEDGTPTFPSYNAGGRTPAREYPDEQRKADSAGCTRRTTTSTTLPRAGWRSTGKAFASPGAAWSQDSPPWPCGDGCRVGIESPFAVGQRVRAPGWASPGAIPECDARRPVSLAAGPPECWPTWSPRCLYSRSGRATQIGERSGADLQSAIGGRLRPAVGAAAEPDRADLLAASARRLEPAESDSRHRARCSTPHGDCVKM